MLSVDVVHTCGPGTKLLGEVCTCNADCRSVNSVCDSWSKCSCPSGTLTQGDTCILG